MQSKIKYELVQEQDGSYSAFTPEGIITHAEAINESENDIAGHKVHVKY